MVDVGSGTGKATTSFVELTCIEPDRQVAAALRDRTQATVINGRLEDWRLPAGEVDLILFPQSWHWIEPSARSGACARAARSPSSANLVLARRA